MIQEDDDDGRRQEEKYKKQARGKRIRGTVDGAEGQHRPSSPTKEVCTHQTRGEGDRVMPLEAFQRVVELLLQLLGSNRLCCHRHLADELL